MVNKILSIEDARFVSKFAVRGMRLTAIEVLRKKLGCDILEAQRIVDCGRNMTEDDFFWYLCMTVVNDPTAVELHAVRMKNLWDQRVSDIRRERKYG